VGTLTFPTSLSFASGSTYAVEINSDVSADKIAVTGALAANGTIAVTLGASYTPTINTVFDVADFGSVSGTPVFSFTNSSSSAWDTSTFATNGTIKYIGDTDPYNAWAATRYSLVGGAAAKGADPDGDGVINLLEFATDSDPTKGSSGPRCHPLMYVIGADNALTYTIAVRKLATFTAAGNKQTVTKDKVKYTVEASNNLADSWTPVQVTELSSGDAALVQAALGAKLSGLNADWEWHTFRTDNGAGSDPNDFIRLKVEDVP
jgi:hypothetical protein